MKKLTQYLRIVVIFILVLEAVISAGCNTVNNTAVNSSNNAANTADIDSTNDATNTADINGSNGTINTADINSSYEAIKKAYADNPSNSEISFIYDAINNEISEYPKTVPDFIDLPIECIIDAIDTDAKIHIEYADDDNYENGIIIAQEPKKGAAWDDGVVVNLTVNRKYSSINSKQGYMGESLGKLSLLTTTYNGDTGTIWADGEKLVEGEITRIYADNGNVYYNDGSGVNRLNTKGVSKVLEKKTIQHVVNNENIYYRDIENEDGNFYCYNMNDKTDSLIYDGKVMFLYANSDYIICYSPHDIFILDNESYKIIKKIHSEKMIVDCSLDKNKLYFVQKTYSSNGKDRVELTKYSIKQDEQITILDSNEPIGSIFAADDKIILIQYLNKNEAGFRYIDMRNIENKFFTIDNDFFESIIIDILFDGQRIIYEKEDGTFYSISIFTGETKKIELIS